jgi:hypothetical protein
MLRTLGSITEKDWVPVLVKVCTQYDVPPTEIDEIVPPEAIAAQ